LEAVEYGVLTRPARYRSRRFGIILLGWNSSGSSNNGSSVSISRLKSSAIFDELCLTDGKSDSQCALILQGLVVHVKTIVFIVISGARQLRAEMTE
jgi:hypothetical protein